MNKIDFKKEYYDFVMRLLKQGGANPAEKQEIFRLYKLFIDPTHKQFTDTGCASCTSSIQLMWTKLKTFVIENKEKFIK